MTPVLYRIDRHDRIVETGGAWDEFADANGGVGAVTGHLLWQFVAGEDVRAIWSLLLRRARTKGEPIAFVYRCDAPGLARVLRMELCPHRDDSVTFRSTQVQSTPARTFSGRWQVSAARRPPVAVCGWCARVHLAGSWVPPEHAAEALGLVGHEQPRLSHGICDTCAYELRSAVARSHATTSSALRSGGNTG